MGNPFRAFIPAGIVSFGIAPGLALLAEAHGHFFGGSNAVLLGIFVATTVVAVAVRQTAWLASFAAVLVGFTLGLGAIALSQEAVASPWGDTLMERGSRRHFPEALRRVRQSERADLAFLRKGLKAAEENKPLVAPEGGYLVPRDLGTSARSSGIATPIRYVSIPSSQATLAAWRQALTTQEKAARHSLEGDSFSPTSRITAWLMPAALLFASCLFLAVISNLAALAARALAGDAR